MKKIVFQINIKPKGSNRTDWYNKAQVYNGDLYWYSRQKARRYAKKHNCDYYCLDSTEWLGEQYEPIFHKFYIYELLKEYDKVLFLDSDCIITKVCPNIFKFHEFSAPIDQWQPEKMIRLNRLHGFPDDWKMFCSGVMLFDKKFYERTKDFWRDEFYKWNSIHQDQSAFNILIYRYYGKYNSLSGHWGTWWMNGKYIRHYASVFNKMEWNPTEFEEWESKL